MSVIIVFNGIFACQRWVKLELDAVKANKIVKLHQEAFAIDIIAEGFSE